MNIQILLHDIKYWYNEHEGLKLLKADEEHIEQEIKRGNREGEIISVHPKTNDSIYGWWKIV